MAALIGAIVGIPSLRIKGIYLAIATLAAQLIIEWTINHVPAISGGVQASIQVPRPTVFGTPLKTQAQLYLFLMFFVVLAIVGTANLIRSRIGSTGCGATSAITFACGHSRTNHKQLIGEVRNEDNFDIARSRSSAGRRRHGHGTAEGRDPDRRAVRSDRSDPDRRHSAMRGGAGLYQSRQFARRGGRLQAQGRRDRP